MNPFRPILAVRAALLAAAGICAVCTLAAAQWSPDPMQNLIVADRSSEQVTPKIAATSDGGCYIGWFDLASGNYDVYLQHLDAEGYEQWPHNGILVSGHPQNSSLVDWSLIADADDNAVLVFSDARGGSDLDIQAYRISPAGAFLWGADGVTLSTNDDFEPAPVVAQASDGDFVFVWARMPDTEDPDLRMQRLSPAGVERFPHGGLAVVAPGGETPAFCSAIPSLDGDVIVLWVRDISTFMSPRHVRAARFDETGSAAWGPIAVFDAGPVPIAHTPQLRADGAGGAVAYWHRSEGTLFNSFVQRLSADGVERFAHNGVAVSTRAGFNHIDPSVAFVPSTGDCFIFWDERTSNQNAWGVYGQRITEAGTRAWGDNGIEFLPVTTLYKWAIRTVPSGAGAMVFYLDEPGGVYNENRVMGFAVDASGTAWWPGWPIEVSAYLSGKSRLPVLMGPDGVARMVWEDERADAADLYAQNVNPDGSLGPGSVDAPDGLPGGGTPLPTSTVALLGRPNPFRDGIRIAAAAPFSGATASTHVLRIVDPSGRAVRTITGSGGSWFWDGLDASGSPVPAGVYHGRVLGESGASIRIVRVR